MSHSPVRLSLSAKGLKRLETVNHHRDFQFIVGHDRYTCPSFVAEFLSPRITSLRCQDITVDDFSIEAKDSDHQFGTLLSVGYGREVSMSPRAIGFVRSVCAELGNSELFEKTLRQNDGEITVNELKARMALLASVDGSFDCGIRFLSSHFHLLSVSDFDHVSVSVLESILSDQALVVRDEDSVFEVVYRRACKDASYLPLLEFVRFEFVTADCLKRAVDLISGSLDSLTFGIWSSLRNRLTLSVTPASRSERLASPAIDSKIISAIPDIFVDFSDRQIQLLYRGSRDGFAAATFHSLCNGHPNTITLILSKNGSVFGGFTPLAWSSRNTYTMDPSGKSFLFTINNPHNLPARIFRQMGAFAIYDDELHGPTFAGSCDLLVCDQCHSRQQSRTCLGGAFLNDTGIPGDKVLNGHENFTVEEIEVFQVI
jgi:hypothetical protein